VTETVFFNASSSRAATGRTIVSYDWAFGNGTTGTGITTTRAFASAGTYSVTLTVTDDLGKRAVISRTVTVTSLSAVFTFSPTNPLGNETVWFDASGSTGVNPIVTYAWDFGDGTSSTGVRVPHSYVTCIGGATATDRSFVVRLTITDSLGVTANTTQTVTVRSCR
jgi:PKD repeat protein